MSQSRAKAWPAARARPAAPESCRLAVVDDVHEPVTVAMGCCPCSMSMIVRRRNPRLASSVRSSPRRQAPGDAGVGHRLQQFAVARTPKATDPAHDAGSLPSAAAALSAGSRGRADLERRYARIGSRPVGDRDEAARAGSGSVCRSLAAIAAETLSGSVGARFADTLDENSEDWFLMRSNDSRSAGGEADFVAPPDDRGRQVDDVHLPPPLGGGWTSSGHDQPGLQVILHRGRRE